MEFFFLRYFSPFQMPKVHGRTLHDVEQSLYYQNIKKLHPELVLSALPFRDLYGRLCSIGNVWRHRKINVFCMFDGPFCCFAY